MESNTRTIINISVKLFLWILKGGLYVAVDGKAAVMMMMQKKKMKKMKKVKKKKMMMI